MSEEKQLLLIAREMLNNIFSRKEVNPQFKKGTEYASALIKQVDNITMLLDAPLTREDRKDAEGLMYALNLIVEDALNLIVEDELIGFNSVSLLSTVGIDIIERCQKLFKKYFTIESSLRAEFVKKDELLNYILNTK